MRPCGFDSGTLEPVAGPAGVTDPGGSTNRETRSRPGSATYTLTDSPRTAWNTARPPALMPLPSVGEMWIEAASPKAPSGRPSAASKICTRSVSESST